MGLIDVFILDAVRKGADDVVISEGPETNTVKLEAVKH